MNKSKFEWLERHVKSFSMYYSTIKAFINNERQSMQHDLLVVIIIYPWKSIMHGDNNIYIIFQHS
jgi:hypothetical protein